MITIKIQILNTSSDGREKLLYNKAIFLNEDPKFNIVSGETNIPLQAYMQDIIKRQKAEGRIRTSETYFATLKSFLTFLKSKNISVNELSSSLVQSYEAWLKAKGSIVEHRIVLYAHSSGCLQSGCSRRFGMRPATILSSLHRCGKNGKTGRINARY